MVSHRITRVFFFNIRRGPINTESSPRSLLFQDLQTGGKGEELNKDHTRCAPALKMLGLQTDGRLDSDPRVSSDGSLDYTPPFSYRQLLQCQIAARGNTHTHLSTYFQSFGVYV